MTRKLVFPVVLVYILVLQSFCKPVQIQPQSATPTLNIVNPAFVYCEQQGGQSMLVKFADGSQGGLCIFPDRSGCDE